MGTKRRSRVRSRRVLVLVLRVPLLGHHGEGGDSAPASSLMLLLCVAMKGCVGVRLVVVAGDLSGHHTSSGVCPYEYMMLCVILCSICVCS